jgi:hypothetical protein
MPWFPDLSPYVYTAFALPGTVNVGWLAGQFPSGPTPVAFRERLVALCREAVVNRMAGVHLCPFCAAATGSGEIHVAGTCGRVFAAPMLVAHYVTAHDYRPPEEFIEAVSNGTTVNPEPSDPDEYLAIALIHRIKRRQPDPSELANVIRRLRMVVTRLGHTSVAGEAALLLERFEEFQRRVPAT